MKIMLTLSALGLLLTSACTTTTSDASIHHRLIGVWSADPEQQPGKVVEVGPDGIAVARKDGVEKARGKWEVSGGYLIWGLGSNTVESNKVLRVSGNTMVILSIDGHTELTFHKQ
jgi:hypothetical protein